MTTSPKTNHAEKAREYLAGPLSSPATAQLHATLALEAQTARLADEQRTANDLARIANLIALATVADGPLSEQVAGDARYALAEFIDHDDEDLGGWLELRPTIAARLDLTQDVTP